MTYLLPSCIVYQDRDFPFGEGLVFSLPPGWGWSYVGDAWNDKISSVVILSGTWQFFEHAGFRGAFVTRGPGWYPWVESPQFNMQNDTISSILCVSDQPQGDHPAYGSL